MRSDRERVDPGRLSACKEAIRELIEPSILLGVLFATLERRGFTIDEIDAGLRAVDDESEIFERSFDHPSIRYEVELSLTPFESTDNGDTSPEDLPPADPRPKEATAKELKRLVNALKLILELQEPAGCARFVVEDRLIANGFTEQEVAWAIAAAEDYGLSDVDEFQVQPDSGAVDSRNGAPGVIPTDVLVGIVERYCPPLPWIGRSQMYSAVRRMQAEKELGVPVGKRVMYLISVKDGKRAGELTEPEWEAFYERLGRQLEKNYPEEYQRLFC